MKRYDEDKIKQFIEVVGTIPSNISIILNLMAETNLRINEILFLEKDCVKIDEDGYHLCYKPYKGIQDKIFEIKITNKIAELLNNQKEEANKEFPKSKYIFAVSNGRVYRYSQFNKDIERLSGRRGMQMKDFLVYTPNSNNDNTFEV